MALNSIVLSIISAVIGGFVFSAEGAAFGLVIGYLFGTVTNLNKRVSRIENSLTSLKTEKDPHKTGTDKQATERHNRPNKKPETMPLPLPPAKPRAAAHQSANSYSTVSDSCSAKTQTRHETISPHSRRPSFSDRMFEYISDFFSGGNVVVRVGLIILFFGVTFLIKFAADRNMFPIELRLCCVAMGAMILLAIGWHLRHKRPGYAVLLQGGSMGILFLNVFAAAKMYHLLPVSFSFLLMVIMVTATGILSLFQNARALAVFGIIGGFLAPVLMSTGQGNHVFLFSYYAFLNAGILGIAWFKAWRELNLIGFVFTFVIGMTWGYKYYQPAFFTSTEPFLILSFLFYAAISLLYTIRQPEQFKGYLDGTLVFSLPLIVFGLQSAMVSNYQYGAAISAVLLSVFYISAASVLWYRKIEGTQYLKEAFLSIGVVFASLAIPLAFNSTWTSCLWSIKGVGLVWIGLRQRRLLARNFGLLLQLLSGISFLSALPLNVTVTPILNGLYMSCFMISISGIISNYLYESSRDRLKSFEKSFHVLLIIWGLLWWFGGGFNEMAYYIPPIGLPQASLLFISFSCLIMGWLSRRLHWEDMRFPPIGLMPFATIIAAGTFISGHFPHPFAQWGAVSWAAAILTQYNLLWLFEKKWDQKLLHVLQQLTMNVIIFLMTWEIAWSIGAVLNGSSIWEYICWGAVPALSVTFLQKFGRQITWPVNRFSEDYRGQGLMPVICYLLYWGIATCFITGNTLPMTYLPLINPVDMAQLFVLFTIIKWGGKIRKKTPAVFSKVSYQALPYAIGAAAFLLLNAVLARTVHFWANVSFTPQALFESVLFQATLSIAWTITALGIMAAASRKNSRFIWLAGSVLLGIVVGKLFLIDLASIGTVARIISFLAVGLLMLVIGYVSPLPPGKTEDAAANF